MSSAEPTETLSQLLDPCAAQCRQDLEQWLAEPGVPASLGQAMHYCIEGGKRIRAALVLLFCQAMGGDARQECPRRCALAVECIHAYSLVHDDLPAMDDDQLRRGRPTAHVKFGEAMAILAGDALLTRAFGLIAETRDPRAGELAGILAGGAGAAGMIAGQVADMELCDVPDGDEGVEYIHRRKTGALIEASARMGALCGGGRNQALENAALYAREVGLAFQIVDDLLDVTGSAADLGKTPGKDVQAGKRTSVSQTGIQGARQRAALHTQNALKAIADLGPEADRLRKLARLLEQRTR